MIRYIHPILYHEITKEEACELFIKTGYMLQQMEIKNDNTDKQT